jgi:hypothetical protein
MANATTALHALGGCAAALTLLFVAPAVQAQSTAQYAVGLSGLHCPVECGREARVRIGRLLGVADVEVNRNTRTALITMQPGAELDRQAVTGALAGTDFGVTTFEPLRRTPGAP